MKKHGTIIVLIWLTALSGFGQIFKGQIDPAKLPVPSQHYEQEYAWDTTLNREAWHSQKQGLNISFASTDELFFRTEVPDLEKRTTSWTATGWKGERLNAQVLLWSPDSLRQLRFSLTDLKSSSGKLITKNNMTVNMIRYVASNYPYGSKDATCGTSKLNET